MMYLDAEFFWMGSTSGSFDSTGDFVTILGFSFSIDFELYLSEFRLDSWRLSIEDIVGWSYREDLPVSAIIIIGDGHPEVETREF